MTVYVVAVPCERWEDCVVGGALRVKLVEEGRTSDCLIGSERPELAAILARRLSDRAQAIPLHREAPLNLPELGSDTVTVLLVNREEEIDDFLRFPEQRGCWARRVPVPVGSG